MKIYSSIIFLVILTSGCATTTMQTQKDRVRILPDSPPVVTQPVVVSENRKATPIYTNQRIFNSLDECLAVVGGGVFTPYEPKYLNNAKKNLPNDSTIFLAFVEQSGCIRMDTVGNTGPQKAKYVILQKGMQIRIDASGKPLFDHRCGNRLYGQIEYPEKIIQKQIVTPPPVVQAQVAPPTCPPRTPNELPGVVEVVNGVTYCTYDVVTNVATESDFSLSEALLCGASGALAGAASTGFTNPFAPLVGFGIGLGSQTVGRYFWGPTGGRVACMFGVAGAGAFGAFGPFDANSHHHHHHDTSQPKPPDVVTNPPVDGIVAPPDVVTNPPGDGIVIPPDVVTNPPVDGTIAPPSVHTEPATPGVDNFIPEPPQVSTLPAMPGVQTGGFLPSVTNVIMTPSGPGVTSY